MINFGLKLLTFDLAAPIWHLPSLNMTLSKKCFTWQMRSCHAVFLPGNSYLLPRFSFLDLHWWLSCVFYFLSTQVITSHSWLEAPGEQGPYLTGLGVTTSANTRECCLCIRCLAFHSFFPMPLLAGLRSMPSTQGSHGPLASYKLVNTCRMHEWFSI